MAAPCLYMWAVVLLSLVASGMVYCVKNTFQILVQKNVAPGMEAAKRKKKNFRVVSLTNTEHLESHSQQVEGKQLFLPKEAKCPDVLFHHVKLSLWIGLRKLNCKAKLSIYWLLQTPSMTTNSG